MNAIINIGLLLQKIREKGCHGFNDASGLCRTSPRNFVKLSRGELPRLDALQRICLGLGISEQDLVVGMPKPKPEQPATISELTKKAL